jgi:4-hydroxy-tetrahydrodipicolinate synthase
VTPFDDAGVNQGVLREFVEFQIQEGTDALIVCGSTGEAAAMSVDEQRVAVETVVETARGRIPVIAGCGGSDTAQVERLARQARDAGADALLLSAPPYNKPPQRGIALHFQRVMDAGQLPAIIYNVPGRTSVNILPATIEELCRDERVIGVKEACGDIAQIAELCRRVANRVIIWSGNDDQVVPIMSLGGRGVISVLGNIAPRDTSRMAHAYLDGDTTTARELQLRYLPLINALFAESNPIPVKTAVRWLGFNAGPLRAPLVEADPKLRAQLEQTMQQAGLAPLSLKA